MQERSAGLIKGTGPLIMILGRPENTIFWAYSFLLKQRITEAATECRTGFCRTVGRDNYEFSNDWKLFFSWWAAYKYCILKQTNERKLSWLLGTKLIILPEKGIWPLPFSKILCWMKRTCAPTTTVPPTLFWQLHCFTIVIFGSLSLRFFRILK